MDFEEFSVNIRKARGKKGDFKITNSVGVFDIYRSIRKKKWPGIGKPVPVKEYLAIIREVNKLLAKELSEGNTVKFPHRMGRLEIVKYDNTATFVDGKLKISYPVDWYNTLKLWYEDPEAKASKIVVRVKEKERFYINYSKRGAHYENKVYYDFAPNRFLRVAMLNNAKEGKIETMYRR